MALSFAHATKRIAVPQVDAAPLLLQALVNAIRDEEASERGIAYDQIADATGKEDLGGGVQTGITLALRSTWKIEFAAGAYQATITGGNLADALNRVYNTGNPQVLVLASAAATLVETGVSGLTPSEAADVADSHTMLSELHLIHGLTAGSPLSVTSVARTAGAVSQAIAEAAGTVTVTRQ